MEKMAQIAAHESTKATQLYNRIDDDELTLNEMESVMI